MGGERDPTRRKQLRKNRQNEKRQNLLITDYIRHKYSNVYAEALHFYTRLNDRHPNKTDLRKTDEYRFWKSGVPCMSESPQNQEQEPQPPSPVSSEPHESQPQSPVSSEPHESQPPSPVSSEPHESQPPSPVSSEPHESQPPSPVISEPPSPSSSEPQSPGKNIYTDNLQLRIPIQRYRTVKNGHSITTQTVSIVTDEVIEESAQEQPGTVQIPQLEALQPTLIEELPADLVQEVIDQLREDPDLMNMFDNIDEQLNFEEMDFEITEHSLLEKELENW